MDESWPLFAARLSGPTPTRGNRAPGSEHRRLSAGCREGGVNPDLLGELARKRRQRRFSLEETKCLGQHSAAALRRCLVARAAKYLERGPGYLAVHLLATGERHQ